MSGSLVDKIRFMSVHWQASKPRSADLRGSFHHDNFQPGICSTSPPPAVLFREMAPPAVRGLKAALNSTGKFKFKVSLSLNPWASASNNTHTRVLMQQSTFSLLEEVGLYITSVP